MTGGDFDEIFTSMVADVQELATAARLAAWVRTASMTPENQAVRLSGPVQLEAYSGSFLDRAALWLQTQFQEFPSRLAGIFDQEAVASRVLSGETDVKLLSSINDALQESLIRGDGRKEWSGRLAEIVTVKPGFAETLGRTTVHRAYYEGQQEVLDEPEMQDVFPYRKYLATMDNRVRDDHAEMNNKVYHKDSRLANEATANLHEFNCRCSEVPLTESQAIAEGISPGGEAPSRPARETNRQRSLIRQTKPSQVVESVESQRVSLINRIIEGINTLEG